ncbi:MAG: hypothetical protein JXQ99_05365 [Hyphomicrobiaceae bacterium]
MSKAILLGLWGCIITLAASYGAMMMAAPAENNKSKKASYFGGVDYVKAPMIAVPIIKEKKLTGYVVAEFVFTIEQKVFNSLSVTPDPSLLMPHFGEFIRGRQLILIT